MKNPLRPLVFAGLCVVLAAGCHKKEEPAAEVARDAESKLPAQEQVAPAPKTDATGAPVVATATVNANEKDAYEAWFKKYHLDLNDPKMLDADPDGDGFTNREEFLANTDPLDPTSHPPLTDPAKALRLKEYNEARLPITLENIEGEKARLKRTDGEGKVETVKQGDTLRGLPLKVLKIEARQDIDKNGEHVDLSQVTLEDSSTKEKYVLTGNLPAKTSASYAVLETNDGKAVLKVHHGDVFTWPTEGGTNYKVIDMSQDQVVIQQMDNKKMWTIPRP
ncbi:MAG: Amuc_1099 family pilus-like system protein [Chthoniobacter sp.]|uniref:Amuc_1099 family pilus-like system protein n=1 Tax=Chthoniobacter sp. TaxID=2510640 RepID=UPI0032A15CB7